MGSKTRRIRGFRTVFSIALLCVLSAAGPALAGEDASGAKPAEAATVDIAGRWEGRTYELARSDGCDGKPCTLTLDLVRCAAGWCGVEVIGAGHRCGATALRLDAGEANPNGPAVFKGKLELAQGTEPYVIEAYLVGPSAGDDTSELQLTGDTGGEFRMFRRSFPFNATLVRAGDAQCRPDATVSMLVE